MANQQSPAVRKTVHLQCLKKKEDSNQDGAAKQTFSVAKPILQQKTRTVKSNSDANEPCCSNAATASTKVSKSVAFHDVSASPTKRTVDETETRAEEEQGEEEGEEEMSETDKIIFGNTKVAPNELFMEFFDCLVTKDYATAAKLCDMILLYEPKHTEALEFREVIKERLKLDAEKLEDGDDDDEDDDEEESSGNDEDDDSSTAGSDDDSEESEEASEDEKPNVVRAQVDSERSSGDSGLNSGASSSLENRPATDQMSGNTVAKASAANASQRRSKTEKGLSVDGAASSTTSQSAVGQTVTSRRGSAQSASKASSSGRAAYSASSVGGGSAKRSLKSSTVTSDEK